MWNLFRSKPLPAALDIDAVGMRMMQLVPDGTGQRLVACARRTFRSADGPARAQEIRQVVESGEFTTRDVITAIPADLLHLRTLRLPLVQAEEIEAKVRQDAEHVFPFNLADASLHCINAGVVRQGREDRLEVIAAASLPQDIAAFVAGLESAGLHCKSPRLAPVAPLQCAAAALAANDDEIIAVIHIDRSATTVIIARGTSPLFMKRIEIGSRHLNEAVAGKVGVTPEEAAQLRRRAGADEAADRAASLSESAASNLSYGPAMNPSNDPAVSLPNGPAVGLPNGPALSLPNGPALSLSNGPALSLSNGAVGGAVYAAVRGLVEQLARDVETCFRYFGVAFRGKRPSRIALLGAEADDVRVQSAIAAVAPGEIIVVDPAAGIDLSAMRSSDRDASRGEWATCMGLLQPAKFHAHAVPLTKSA